MSNWWYISGKNMLCGIEGDDDNPPELPAAYIAGFFNMIPASITGYHQVRSELTTAEQDRVDGLLRQAQGIESDPSKVTDAFQSTLNKQGVRTSGAYGGTRRGGNT